MSASQDQQGAVNVPGGSQLEVAAGDQFFVLTGIFAGLRHKFHARPRWSKERG